MIKIYEIWKEDEELHGGDVIALSCEKWKKIVHVLDQLFYVMSRSETCALCMSNCKNCKDCTLAQHDAPCLSPDSAFRQARTALEEACLSSGRVLHLLQTLPVDYLLGDDDDET